MVKARKSKGGKAFGAKKPAVERIKKQNPFDLIFKKSKTQTTIGVKSGQQPKFSSKRRAFDVRRSTIGVEYANDGKKNTIVDKRLAERDSELSAAQKAEKRFILQRKQLFSSKKARFNLADDGKNGAGNDEDADEDGLFPKTNGKFQLRKKVEKDLDGGELDSNLVALANFGGGKFEEQKRAENLFSANGGTKRGDVLANLISASKQTKALRQMERDAQADTTDNLNLLFSRLKNAGVLEVGGVGPPPPASLAPAVATDNFSAAAPNATNNENAGSAPENNSYDNLYRELQFDSGRRAMATTTKVFAELGKPEDFGAILTEFEKFSEICTTENVEKIALITDKISSHIKVRPFICAQRLLALLTAQRTRHLAAAKSDANFGGVDFQTLSFVRMIGRVCPTGDRFHSVATPTLLFATEVLARSRVRSAAHAAQLIFFCDVLADWISVSKRYFPEVVAFLRGVLLLCVENEEAEKFPSISFPITSPFRRMLCVEKKTKAKVEPISMTQLFGVEAETHTTNDGGETSSAKRRETERAELRQKLRTIGALLMTIRRYAELYSAHTVSFYAIFRPFFELLKRLPCENFPKELSDEAASVTEFVGGKFDSAPSLTHLKLPTRSVQRPLEMLEPRFDANFDPETSRFGGGGGAARKARKTEQAMRQRLRKETRGAMKELRTDAKFISRLQSDRSQKVSRERREKTKKILAGLQTQESEYKKRHIKKY